MAFNIEDDENRNDAAARAISKITNKLQGYMKIPLTKVSQAR